MAGTKTPQTRPLSPHLQIYRPMLTMMMSITHRLTGAALYFGTLLLAWWLIAAATGPGAYTTFQNFIGSLVGQIILFGYLWALIHHALGGLKHFIWDLGHGLDVNKAEWMARLSLLGSITLSVIIWLIATSVIGI